MSRRRAAEKREILPDAKFGDVVVNKFMNNIMIDGKKSAAEGIVYGAFDMIEKREGLTRGVVEFARCIGVRWCVDFDAELGTHCGMDKNVTSLALCVGDVPAVGAPLPFHLKAWKDIVPSGTGDVRDAPVTIPLLLIP